MVTGISSGELKENDSVIDGKSKNYFSKGYSEMQLFIGCCYFSWFIFIYNDKDFLLFAFEDYYTSSSVDSLILLIFDSVL